MPYAKFDFAADRNTLVDACLVSGAKNGCKAEF